MIIPGPLSETTAELQQKLDVIRRFTNPPQVIQVDIVDGEFADTLTFEPSGLREVDTQGFHIDLHLMTIEPAQFLTELFDLPQTNIRRVIGQVEKMGSIGEFISQVQEDLGKEAGLSLDLYTQLEAFQSDDDEEIIDYLDQVAVIQVMGNKAGEQGQSLHPTALETLQKVVAYKKRHNLSFAVSFDIGMNPETIPQVLALGATEVVVGSYLQGPDAAAHWEELKALA